MPATKKTTVKNNGDAMAAAKAAARYRERKLKQGYAPLQVWVPARMRADLLDLVNRTVEEQLAMEAREGGDDAEDDDAGDPDSPDRMGAPARAEA